MAQAYGRELQEAYDWCQRYKVSCRDAELHQAWDLYYHVFKRINKQLPSLTVLELQYVAPALVRAQVQCCSLLCAATLVRRGNLCPYTKSQGQGNGSPLTVHVTGDRSPHFKRCNACCRDSSWQFPVHI